MQCSKSTGFVDASARAGFMHDDLGETWQHRLKTFPYPDRYILAGRVCQSIDLIEQM